MRYPRNLKNRSQKKRYLYYVCAYLDVLKVNPIKNGLPSGDKVLFIDKEWRFPIAFAEVASNGYCLFKIDVTDDDIFSPIFENEIFKYRAFIYPDKIKPEKIEFVDCYEFDREEITKLIEDLLSLNEVEEVMDELERNLKK